MKNRHYSLLAVAALSMSGMAHGQEFPEQVIESRYTLLKVGAAMDQYSLLESVIDIQLPESVTTVGKAIEAILLPTGYRLRQDVDAFSEQYILLMLPMPSPHRHLGPITLIESLNVLGGNSFEAVINPVTRSVTFTLKESFEHFVSQQDKEVARERWFNKADDYSPIEISPRILQPESFSHYGMIDYGETLSSITENIGLNGLTLAQRMVQIFDANPQAFANQNMNDLYQGSILTIPTQEAASLPPVEANRVVTAHYERWQEKRVGQ